MRKRIAVPEVLPARGRGPSPDLVRQQLAEAQRQAETIVHNAEEEARLRLRGISAPAGEAQFRREDAAAPGFGLPPTEEVRVNRVDRGRKFGRPQT